jgi:glycosyltransferase involved in cell wall biosynthesis
MKDPDESLSVMKVFILADPNSTHTKRWVSSLSDRGINIFLFGISRVEDDFYSELKSFTLYTVDITSESERTSLLKLRYLRVVKILKTKIKDFNPDIVHAHYASSYGLLGTLTRFHPYIISMWGTDIYEFPGISIIHRSILRYNLSSADIILSTSKVMAAEAKKYTRRQILVTPFGVDLNIFRKLDVEKQKNEFIVGTVKSLSANYGIDILIRSFNLVCLKNPDLNLKLQIIGSGPEKMNLQSLASQLGIEDNVYFLGRIENKLLPQYYNRFSVFVSLSELESFGVVAVEAMACECPVIVSDADGFTEVVEDGITGYIITGRELEATALAIQKFIDDRSLGVRMGRNGRKRVEELYDWTKNVSQMIGIYNSVIQ